MRWITPGKFSESEMGFFYFILFFYFGARRHKADVISQVHVWVKARSRRRTLSSGWWWNSLQPAANHHWEDNSEYFPSKTPDFPWILSKCFFIFLSKVKLFFLFIFLAALLLLSLLSSMCERKTWGSDQTFLTWNKSMYYFAVFLLRLSPKETLLTVTSFSSTVVKATAWWTTSDQTEDSVGAAINPVSPLSSVSSICSKINLRNKSFCFSFLVRTVFFFFIFF